MTEDAGGQMVAHGCCKHNHPNHAKAIENVVHIQRLREEVKDERNKYVRTKTVVSSVRNETLSADGKAPTTDLHRGS